MGTGTVRQDSVPIRDISDAVGHKSPHVAETVYPHVTAAIRGGAVIPNCAFTDEPGPSNASEHSDNAEIASSLG